MTTIKSADGLSNKKLAVDVSKPGGTTYLRAYREGAEGTFIVVNTSDLLSALGIDELGCGCDQADENLKVALNRAESAEAEALEQAKLVRTWADRAEKAEAELEELRARVSMRLKGILPSNEVRAIFDPFVLPAEVPARIEVFRHDGITPPVTFYLWSNGTGHPTNGLVWINEDDWSEAKSPKEILSGFTGHRVLGGDE